MTGTEQIVGDEQMRQHMVAVPFHRPENQGQRGQPDWT